jgi:hypothetical protein
LNGEPVTSLSDAIVKEEEEEKEEGRMDPRKEHTEKCCHVFCVCGRGGEGMEGAHFLAAASRWEGHDGIEKSKQKVVIFFREELRLQSKTERNRKVVNGSHHIQRENEKTHRSKKAVTMRTLEMYLEKLCAKRDRGGTVNGEGS